MYEGKISREFDEKKLSCRALTEWKFQRYLKDYLATARSLDRSVAALLGYLDRTGLASNTVVVYTSDQGFYLGEHGWFDKRFIYEKSLKTPFLIRYPGVIRPRTEVEKLVSNLDWAPTLLALTKTVIPKAMQGRSFVPALTGHRAPAAGQAAYYHYYEYPQHQVYPHFGLRTARYTLARFYGPGNFWELYDIKQDPYNLHNLYDAKEYRALAETLKKELRA